MKFPILRPLLFPPANQATLTLLTTINNDNGRNATVNDVGISTNADNLTFNTGTTSGTSTTYTSNTLLINAGNYSLSANDESNYNETLWNCCTYKPKPQNKTFILRIILLIIFNNALFS